MNHRIAEAFPDASRTLLFEFGTVAEVAQVLAADFPQDAAALPPDAAADDAAVPGRPVSTAPPVPQWPVPPRWAAPLPAREIGFSASRVLLDPGADPEDTEMVRDGQGELLDVLLRGVDLDRAGGLVDLHGAGAAGLRLAGRHPALRVHVCATDPTEADLVARVVKEHQLDGRVTVGHGPAIPADPTYQVALGIQGSHLVADQAGRLAAVAAALPDGGRLLLADFLAVGDELRDPRIGVLVPNRERWADLLAAAGFVLDEAVDAGPRVGHFLADFDVDQNTAALDPVDRGRWRFEMDLAVPLERGKVAYLLMRLRKATTADPAARQAENRARIAAATPYAEGMSGR